jgi:Flp pilus assembly protein TadG
MKQPAMFSAPSDNDHRHRDGYPPRWRRRKRGGVTVVEFAVTAPVLLLFFLSAFEFCRVAMIRHTVDNAVYEGCREAIIPGGTAEDARRKAQEILATLAVDHATITVSPAAINDDTTEVTVTVDVPMDSNTFVPPQFTGGSRIERTLTMQREGSSS